MRIFGILMEASKKKTPEFLSFSGNHDGTKR